MWSFSNLMIIISFWKNDRRMVLRGSIFFVSRRLIVLIILSFVLSAVQSWLQLSQIAIQLENITLKFSKSIYWVYSQLIVKLSDFCIDLKTLWSIKILCYSDKFTDTSNCGNPEQIIIQNIFLFKLWKMNYVFSFLSSTKYTVSSVFPECA